MKESAEESDLLCLRSPSIVSQVVPIILERSDLTEYHFAAIQDANDLISRRSVRLDLQKLCSQLVKIRLAEFWLSGSMWPTHLVELM